jgi:hypothetical protein
VVGEVYFDFGLMLASFVQWEMVESGSGCIMQIKTFVSRDDFKCLIGI